MPALPSSHLSIENEISFSEPVPGYPIIEITNHYATASIALHGAHLTSYTPRNQSPVIYNSPTSIYKEGKAIRGGIPICWPWFSAHPTNPELPSHGFARNRFWKLIATSSHTDYTEVTLEIDSRDIPEQIWQNHTTAELTLKVGKSLTASLLTTNRSDQEITIGGALHTYLDISNINNIYLTGVENTSYLDTTNNTSHTQLGTLKINQEVDRIYHPTQNTITINDPEKKRQITIEKSGSNSTIIWNPWIEKAKALADLPDTDYQKFICVETANAQQDTHSLAPGQTHTLTTKITSTPT